jgi:hypothetical protein
MDSTYIVCVVILVITMVLFFAIRFCPNNVVEEDGEEEDLVEE